MPGSYTFRPVEAKLTHNTELIGKMNPYCAFQLGDFVAKSAICKKGGMNPHWDDLVTIPAPLKPVSQLNVHVMDKDRFTSDDIVGTFSINLNEVQNTPSSKWYTLFYKNQPAGEILMEGMFDGERAFMPEATIIEEHTAAGVMPESKIFQEQRQVVENHTFMKEVDVVETRSALQNIEVMEPIKVIKDVEYTEVVPVMKQIETIEPQVVKKQIEVIEPKLVTKTIQVVENVPVIREVEVIESIPVVKEVETFEPQTFTKQVEVTEYVPVSKQVEVTEPVHVKKAVEFIEPVITTQTITKEVREPVIVHEEVKTTVGPATMIDAEERIMKEKLIENKIVESELIKEEKYLL